MDSKTSPTDFTGKLLIAMPGMDDPRFVQSVVFLCAHGDDGAMGLIINKFMGAMKLSDVIDDPDLPKAETDQRLPVHFGGPVEGGRGFVLHSGDYTSEISTLNVCKNFSMTATLDVLEEINRGAGPELALLALGYSGWGPGQLEREIGENGWLVADANPDLVFIEKDDQKWQAALREIGVDPLTLSASSGRA